MSKQDDKTQTLLQSKEQQKQTAELKPKQKKSKFYQKLRNVVLVITLLLAGSSAIFILINVFLFAIQAFQFGRIENIEWEVLQAMLILMCKFMMLVMFTAALIMGSLIPLAMMYVILLPTTTKED